MDDSFIEDICEYLGLGTRKDKDSFRKIWIQDGRLKHGIAWDSRKLTVYGWREYIFKPFVLNHIGRDCLVFWIYRLGIRIEFSKPKVRELSV